MIKRISIILSVLVIVFLSCSRSTQIAKAEEEIKDAFRPGTSLLECKALSRNPEISIKFIREKNDMCKIKDETIFIYENLYCDGTPTKKITPEVGRNELPVEAFSGSGNQYCTEAFVKYIKSPVCFEYTTGGRTYRIGPG